MAGEDNQIHLQVVTPAGIALNEPVHSVVLWTAMGEIEVLRGHVALVVMLEPGELRAYDAQGQEHLFAAGEGFAEINGESVTVLTDLAEDAAGITVEIAEEAKRRAEVAVGEAAKLTDEERRAADLALRESLVRVQIGLRKKGGGRSRPMR